MSGIGVEAGAQAARSRALAVLRVRGRALAVALLPAGAAVILLTGASTGHLVGRGWDAARWTVGVLAVLVLLAAAGIGVVVARSRPAMSPTVPIPEESAPDLYRMVRDLADRLDVPAPSAIALTPDCDSWLEDRTHSAHGPPPRPAPDEIAGPGRRRTPVAPVLVIGSPFLWWMRVGELRAVLAPVVAGTGPSAHPDIAAARRFVRGLDAAVAVASTPGRCPLTRGVCAALGWVARLLLRGCREHAAQMERGVAAAAAERAQAVDYGLRIVAQEQVGLAYAGWDRLLTRVALPAWRMGRWPSRLDAGVVAALTELSRRDRLAEGFASRLGERPACDLLEEPGVVDEAASLLAARLFHGGPAESGPDWAPVDWQAYPEEVVDRTWRADAARLHRVLDSFGVRLSPDPRHPDPGGPTLARLLDHLAEPTSLTRTPATPEPPETPPTTHPNSPTPPDTTTTAPTGAAPGGAALAETASSETVPAEAVPTEAAPAGLGSMDAASARSASSEAASPEAVPSGAASSEVASSKAAPAGAVPSGAAPAEGARTDVAPAEVAPTDAAPAGAGPTDAAPAGAGPTDAAPAGAGPTDAAPAEVGPTDAASARAASSNAAPAEAVPSETVPTDTTLPDPAPGRSLWPPYDDEEDADPATERSAALAAGLSAELAREEAAGPDDGAARRSAERALWDDCDGVLPPFPLHPQRTARELLADHVTAMVCCAAVDTAGAVPALDWLDGPSLLLGGERAADLTPKVLSLIEKGDPGPLREWLARSGIRPEKPVRLV
ncbi:hypothetical protein [Streptomyces sp. NPDC046727]|uniref:hypothetical protein n=1 Tax=Streptomyces sp. NPDC046727 TaxID=3155373 RepID=UPI0033E55B6D